MSSSDQCKEADILLCCSFCDKSQEEVSYIITAPNANICDECVDVCCDTIFESESRKYDENNSFRSPHCPVCAKRTKLEDFVHIPDRGFTCLECMKAISSLRERSTE